MVYKPYNTLYNVSKGGIQSWIGSQSYQVESFGFV